MLCTWPVAAQSYLDLAANVQRPTLYHEMVRVPSDTTTHIHIAFRIPNASLVFLKTQPPAPDGFETTVTVTATLLDANGTTLAVESWTQSHRVDTFDATQDATTDVQGIIAFADTPNATRYRLTVDEGLGKHARRGAFTTGRVAPLIMLGDTGSAEAFTLANTGGALPYGSPTTLLVPLSDADSVRVRLRKLPASMVCPPPVAELLTDLPEEATVYDEHHSRAYVAASMQPQPNGSIHVNLAPDSSAVPSVLLSLGTETLADGIWLLSVTDLNAAVEVAPASYCLRTHWRNMPLSLYDAGVAIQTLRFMLPEDTWKPMLRGRKSNRAARLAAFWAEHDPTPGTVYNELMAEYYQRVDAAAMRFRTGGLVGPDGLRTDQADIFIRYGEPSRIERTTPPTGGVQETWTYANGQRYTFWSPSSLDPFRLQRQ